MNIGDFKQGVRFRCRLDPRLTDDYILNYVKQGLSVVSNLAKAFKYYADITGPILMAGTRRYQLPQGLLTVDFAEYGSTDDYTLNQQVKLSSERDFSVTKDYTDPLSLTIQVPFINLNFDPVDTHILRVHYTAHLNDVLAVFWTVNTNSFDTLIPASAVQPLLEYCAYQHKKNYQKDQFSQMDKAELDMAIQDLSQVYNERTEFME